jgi:flagellar assembly protein FliH
MSSKIRVGADAVPAETLVWPQVGEDAQSAGENKATSDPKALQEKWERDVERRVHDARHAGFQEGTATAQAAAAAELKAAVERLGKTVAELIDLRPRLRRQAEADLLKLAFAIARRILHREVSVDAEALRGLIQSALDKLQSQEIYRVRVHPSQETLVRSMLAHSTQSRQVELVGDPGLERGAALFETARGNLDASVETQLREIEQGLSDRLRHN